MSAKKSDVVQEHSLLIWESCVKDLYFVFQNSLEKQLNVSELGVYYLNKHHITVNKVCREYLKCSKTAMKFKIDFLFDFGDFL